MLHYELKEYLDILYNLVFYLTQAYGLFHNTPTHNECCLLHLESDSPNWNWMEVNYPNP